jgi:putative membrane protein
MTLLAETWNFEAMGVSLLAAGVFGLLGIALLALGFKVFDWITPKLNLEDELMKGNTAVAIAVGAAVIGISLIIVRAIGG